MMSSDVAMTYMTS